MRLSSDLNFEEVAKTCDGFSGAQLKAVCVEAGMNCLRRNGREVEMRDFMEGIGMVLNRKVAEEGYL